VSLSADLLALGEQLAPPEEQWGDPELPAVVLCPRLRTTYSPRVSWRGFAPDPEEGPGPSMPEWARVWDPGPPAPDLGSSLAPNPKRPPRYGLTGLTGNGRRQIWRALSLLEELRGMLSFWTITLPDEALQQLQELDALPVFQDRLRKELVRLLELRGLVPLVVAVVELQPERTAAQGRPAPHWHVVFQGSRRRWRGWVMRPADLDRIIAAALESAGVIGCDLRAAGQVEPVKRSVRAYMAGYMTKKQVNPAPHVGGPWEGLLPRQWWFWSRAMRLEVLRHILPMAFEFLWWCHRHREGIQARELAQFRVLELPDPRAPVTYEVDWGSCEQLAQLVTIWQLDAWDAQWSRTQRLRTCQP
jgi:hypothetical protein